MTDFKSQKKQKLKELKEKMDVFAENGDASGVSACAAQIHAVIQATENDSKNNSERVLIKGN